MSRRFVLDDGYTIYVKKYKQGSVYTIPFPTTNN